MMKRKKDGGDRNEGRGGGGGGHVGVLRHFRDGCEGED